MTPDQPIVRHLARRDDDVAAWLKRKRNELSATLAYRTIDDLLDDYRAHADTGTPLDAEVPQR